MNKQDKLKEVRILNYRISRLYWDTTRLTYFDSVSYAGDKIHKLIKKIGDYVYRINYYTK